MNKLTRSKKKLRVFNWEGKVYGWRYVWKSDSSNFILKRTPSGNVFKRVVMLDDISCYIVKGDE